jgi:hypothetical protein
MSANFNMAASRRGNSILLDQMTDYPTLTQQATFAARIGSLLEAVAKRIVILPEDQREAGLTRVRRTYAAELKENGLDNEHGRKWLDLQIDGIRRLVAEMEISSDEGAINMT